MEFDRVKWLKAAKRCEERVNIEKMNAAAIELEEFLNGPGGIAAMHQLLRATNQHIILGKTNPVHPRENVTVYALCGGIFSGLWGYCVVSEGNLAPESYVSSEHISPCIAVEAAVKYHHIAPEDFMKWLYEQLDKIADSIP